MSQPNEFDAPLVSLVEGSPIGERLVFALLADVALEMIVESVEHGIGVIKCALTDHRALLVRAARSDAQTLSHLAELMRAPASGGFEVVVLTDAESGSAIIACALSQLYWQRIDLTCVGASGEVEPLNGVADRPVPLRNALLTPPGVATARQWDEIEGHRVRVMAAAREDLQATKAFTHLLETRIPYATWTLIVVLGLLYLLQWATDATESTIALQRLGANVPQFVQEGEWWRLCAAAFLHGGSLHLYGNAMALLFLGRFLEPTLGAARFLLLYLVSAIGGSVASTLFLEPAVTSVGASGAIWGLIVAQAAMIYSPGNLPRGVRAAARRSTLLNIALNSALSFLPGVDFWAHLGGGLAGAALVLTGIVTRGWPQQGAADGIYADGGNREPWWLLPASGVMCALFAVAVPYAIWSGLTWHPEERPRFVLVEDPDIGVAYVVPDDLATRRAAAGQAESVDAAWGDLRTDPARVEISRGTTYERLGGFGINVELAAVVASLARPERDETIVDAPVITRRFGMPIATRSSRLRNGVYAITAVRVTELAWFRVDTFVQPEYRAAWSDVSIRIATSIE